MQYFLNSEGAIVIKNVIKSIQLNKAYLSEIDGVIGDGDHGINMNKGFTMAGERLEEGQNFSDAAKILGQVLMMEIGGSMGPLYGSFFKQLFRETKNEEKITASVFLKMLESSLNVVKELGGAKVGDKTLVDTLSPALDAFKASVEKGNSFRKSLSHLVDAAKKGRDSTLEMVAKVGRSARLGERSRGVLDAGAASSFIILETMSKSIIPILKE